MEKSESAELCISGRVPSWAMLIPLWISFFAMQPGMWGWTWCGSEVSCARAQSDLSWIGAGFPHILALPVSVFARSGSFAFVVFLAIDLALSALVLRRLPKRLSLPHVALVLAVWMALSVATVYLTPYLLVWGWQAGLGR